MLTEANSKPECVNMHYQKSVIKNKSDIQYYLVSVFLQYLSTDKDRALTIQHVELHTGVDLAHLVG